MAEKIVLSSKISPKAIKMLDELNNITGLPKNAILEQLIESHYDEIVRVQPILGVIESKEDRNFIIKEVKENMYTGLKDVIEQYMRYKTNEAYVKGEIEEKPITTLGYWSLDHVNNTQFWDSNIRELIGVDKNVNPSKESFAELLHPDDFEKTYGWLAESIEKKIPYSAELRIMMKDGTIRHILSTCHTTYDHFGKPLISSGTSKFLYDENPS